MRFLIMINLFFLVISAFSQGIIHTAGDSEKNSNGSVNYSVGQTLSAIIQCEVQVPYEIQVITESHLPVKESHICEVSPNPASNHIMLRMNDFDGSEFKLCGSEGKLLMHKKIIGVTTTIPISGIEDQVLILTVLTFRKKLKTFKVIKR